MHLNIISLDLFRTLYTNNLFKHLKTVKRDIIKDDGKLLCRNQVDSNQILKGPTRI